MGAKKKLAKLQKKMNKMRIRHILALSDLCVELDKATYKAIFAEITVSELRYELDELKQSTSNKISLPQVKEELPTFKIEDVSNSNGSSVPS